VFDHAKRGVAVGTADQEDERGGGEVADLIFLVDYDSYL